MVQKHFHFTAYDCKVLSDESRFQVVVTKEHKARNSVRLKHPDKEDRFG